MTKPDPRNWYCDNIDKHYPSGGGFIQALEKLFKDWEAYAQERYEQGLADGAVKACLEG